LLLDVAIPFCGVQSDTSIRNIDDRHDEQFDLRGLGPFARAALEPPGTNRTHEGLASSLSAFNRNGTVSLSIAEPRS
jgi:hypothetical protein